MPVDGKREFYRCRSVVVLKNTFLACIEIPNKIFLYRKVCGVLIQRTFKL